MWNRDRVTVERKTQSNRSPSGQSISSYEVIIPELKCDIVSKSEEAFLHDTGQVIITHKQLITDVADIKNGDIITDLNSGEKYEVVQVLAYKLLPHIKALLKGGVV